MTTHYDAGASIEGDRIAYTFGAVYGTTSGTLEKRGSARVLKALTGSPPFGDKPPAIDCEKADFTCTKHRGPKKVQITGNHRGYEGVLLMASVTVRRPHGNNPNARH